MKIFYECPNGKGELVPITSGNGFITATSKNAGDLLVKCSICGEYHTRVFSVKSLTEADLSVKNQERK